MEVCACFKKPDNWEDVKGGITVSRFDFQSRRRFPDKDEVVCLKGFQNSYKAMLWASLTFDMHCKNVGIYPTDESTKEYSDQYHEKSITCIDTFVQFTYQPESWKDYEIRRRYKGANVTFLNQGLPVTSQKKPFI